MPCVQLHSEQIGIFSTFPLTHLSCRLPVIENSLHEQASINTRITRRFLVAILKSCQRKSSNIQKWKRKKTRMHAHTCTNALTRTGPLRLNKKEKKIEAIIIPYLNVSLQYRQKDFFINWLYIRWKGRGFDHTF